MQNLTACELGFLTGRQKITSLTKSRQKFTCLACMRAALEDRSIWYNDETRERVDRSRDGARLHGRGLRDFGRKFAIGCVLLPQARRRSPRFLGGRRAVGGCRGEAPGGVRPCPALKLP